MNYSDGFDTYTGFEHLAAEKKTPYDKYIAPYIGRILGKKDGVSDEQSTPQSTQQSTPQSTQQTIQQPTQQTTQSTQQPTQQKITLTTRSQALAGYPKLIKLTVTDASGKLIQHNAYINDGTTISGILTTKNGKPAGIITISDDNTAKVQMSRRFNIEGSQISSVESPKNDASSSNGKADDFIVYLKNGVMDDNQQMHGNLKDKLKCSLLYVDKDTVFAKINDGDSEKNTSSLKVDKGLKMLLTYDDKNINKKYVFNVNLL